MYAHNLATYVYTYTGAARARRASREQVSVDTYVSVYVGMYVCKQKRRGTQCGVSDVRVASRWGRDGYVCMCIHSFGMVYVAEIRFQRGFVVGGVTVRWRLGGRGQARWRESGLS